MNNEHWEKAQKLANRAYIVASEQDSLSDGRVIYHLSHPELPGCKAQGITINEAKSNLDQARVDYIYALLEFGLEVPDPSPIVNPSPMVNSQTFFFYASTPQKNDIDTNFGKSVQPNAGSYVLEGDFIKHR